MNQRQNLARSGALGVARRPWTAVLAGLTTAALVLGLMALFGPARAEISPGVEFFAGADFKGGNGFGFYGNGTKKVFLSGGGSDAKVYFLDSQGARLNPTAGIDINAIAIAGGGGITGIIGDPGPIVVHEGSKAAYFGGRVVFTDGKEAGVLFKIDLAADPPVVSRLALLQKSAGSPFDPYHATSAAVAADGSWVAFVGFNYATVFKTSDGTVLSTNLPSNNAGSLGVSGNTLYGAASGNSPTREFWTADMSVPSAPVVTKHPLPSGIATSDGWSGALAVSADGRTLVLAAGDCPAGQAVCDDTKKYLFVYDTADLTQPGDAVTFEDQDTFDFLTACQPNSFGNMRVGTIAIGTEPGVGDTVYVAQIGCNANAEKSGVSAYDLTGKKWRGFAFTHEKPGGSSFPPDQLISPDGKSVVFSQHLVEPKAGGVIPNTAFAPTRLPDSERVDGKTKKAVDIAGYDTTHFALANADGVSVRNTSKGDADGTNYPVPDFATGNVKGESTALTSAAESEIFLKTQNGTEGHLYKLGFGLDQVQFVVAGEWKEVPAPPEGFPDKSTGPGDVVTSPDGSRLYAISKTGIAVYTRGIRQDSSALPLEADTYVKTFPVSGSPLKGLAISSDGKTVYGAGADSLVSVDTSTDKVTTQSVSGLTPTGALAVSADSKTLYAGTRDAAGTGQVTEVDAATLVPGDPRRDSRMNGQFEPVGLAMGTDAAKDDQGNPAPKLTQLWTLGGAAEQFGVLYTASANAWSVGDLSPRPAGCRAVLPKDATSAYAACVGGLYLLRGRGPSFPSSGQIEDPPAGTPVPKAPRVEAPPVDVPSASPTPSPTTGPADKPVSKTTKVKAKAKKKDRLRVKVSENPKLGRGKRWPFTVQKKSGKKWRAVKSKGKVTVWRTSGRKRVKVIDLRKGRYRAVVLPHLGYKGSKSKTVKLQR